MTVSALTAHSITPDISALRSTKQFDGERPRNWAMLAHCFAIEPLESSVGSRE
jgi:hypothetical protein